MSAATVLENFATACTPPAWTSTTVLIAPEAFGKGIQGAVNRS